MDKILRFKTIGSAFFAVVVLLLLQGCSSYENIDFVSGKMNSLKVVSLSSVNAEFEVVVDNPNSFSFHVDNISGVLYMSGQQIATFTSPNKVVVAKKMESTHNVSLVANLTDIAAAAKLLADLENISIDEFTVDLTANVGKGKFVNVPVTKRGLPLKKFVTQLHK